MKYKNAQDILPDRLLKELQQYVSGETLYIPRRQSRKSWGETSGAREYYCIKILTKMMGWSFPEVKCRK